MHQYLHLDAKKIYVIIMRQQAFTVYESGETIFREGESGDLMFILVDGCVEIRKKVENGETVLKKMEKPNEYFGEMAIIDGRPRSATAIATKKTRLIKVDESVFENLILTNPSFALTIIKTLSARIRSSNVRISELIETLPHERIARGMVDFAFENGEQIFDGGYKVHLEELRFWINTRIGVSFEEINKTLARMLKMESIRWAATSTKSHEHLVLPESFIKENNRRSS